MIKWINLCGTNQIKWFPTNPTDNKRKIDDTGKIMCKNLNAEAKKIALHAKRQHKITTIDIECSEWVKKENEK